MIKLFSRAPWGARRRVLPSVAVVTLSLGLQACVDGPQSPAPEPINPNPDVCAYLPVEPVSYKGGNTFGEELTLELLPDTLGYIVTIDASLQRTAGMSYSGTLETLDDCTYTSQEAGAVFTLAPGGVVLGGVTAPDGMGFLPLLAFRDSFNNIDDPAVFNPVACIANVVGIHHEGVNAQPYAASARIRNAGTFQICRDDEADQFSVYAASCSPTDKGYLTYNPERDAFDVFTTDPEGSAVTEGGELSGSVIIGLVGDTAVPVQLVRESSESYGLRMFTLQEEALALGAADGDFLALNNEGGAASSRIAGDVLSRDDSTAALVYNSPVPGVIEASGNIAGNLLFAGGVYGFIPSAPDDEPVTDEPAFEMGVLSSGAITVPTNPPSPSTTPGPTVVPTVVPTIDPTEPPTSPSPTGGPSPTVEPTEPPGPTATPTSTSEPSPTSTPPPVAACGFLPEGPSSFKGGNTWGEELTVSLDPETLAYTVTVDASLQRTAGTQLSGTLTAIDECVYSTDESDAVFTLASGGVLMGGVTAPDDSGFAPLLAFSNTFNNSEDLTRFNDVAFIGNVIGVQYDGAGAQSFGGSSRLRNAGTLQVCLLSDSTRFALYDNNCVPRERGYLTYNTDRNVFERYSTPPEESTPTTGGDLAGSTIIGLVGDDIVMVELARDSGSSYGMRLHTLQPQSSEDATPLVGGNFITLDTDGVVSLATVTGVDITRGSAMGSLTADTPTFGVAEATGGVVGNVITQGGIYAFVPASGGPAFELGVQN